MFVLWQIWSSIFSLILPYWSIMNIVTLTSQIYFPSFFAIYLNTQPAIVCPPTDKCSRSDLSKTRSPRLLSRCQLINASEGSDGVCAMLASPHLMVSISSWWPLTDPHWPSLRLNTRSYADQIIIFCQATLPGMAGINSHILIFSLLWSETCKTENKKIYFHEWCFHDKKSLSFSRKKSLVIRSKWGIVFHTT